MRPSAGTLGALAVLALSAVACARPGTGVGFVSTHTPTPAVALSLAPTPAPTTTNTPTSATTPVERPVVLVGGAAFIVEVAATAEERRRGLAGREALAPGHGMLFVLEAEQVAFFTMRGMRFPLDILWISSDLRVADIAENATPSRTVGPLYQPRVPVRYVLEVNAGEVMAHGIVPGDSIQFRGIPVLDGT